MRLRDLAIPLDPDSRDPLVLQIARGLSEAIREGRLQPGVALPGSRALAEDLGVHRNTVLAAYKELESEGWVESRSGSGTFVAERLPEAPPRLSPSSRSPDEPGFEVPGPAPLPAVEGLLDLTEGLPDPRLVPTEALARAYQRALRLHGPELLGPGEPKGNALLRTVLAARLTERQGLAVDPEQVLVTRGSLMCVPLVVQTLLREGGVVAVEDPGNRLVWEAIQQCAGAVARPVPVDGEGLDLDALEALVEAEPVRLVHVRPIHQFPTTVPLSARRRRRLLAMAREHRFAVLEVASEAEYRYGGPARLPLAAEDPTGQVIYVDSLSRLIAPSVRLGFLVAPRDLVDRLAQARARMDWQGDRILEWSVADLIRDGDLDRHLRKVRRIYLERRDALAGGLVEALGRRLEVVVPETGLSLWVRGRAGFGLDAWVQGCRERGILLHAGRHYRFDGGAAAGTRIGFSVLDEDLLAEVLPRLVQAAG